MRRWTNGLPGATQRLGAMMTQRGLSASQPWMRADTHPGPEHKHSTSEAEYIDAALTFALSELHLAPHGRAIHCGTCATSSTDPCFVCFQVHCRQRWHTGEIAGFDAKQTTR